MDATITDCEFNADGTANIVLNGKVWITIENPPGHVFDACVGTNIETGDGCLLVNGVKWAIAVKYGKRRMRLVNRRGQ